MNSHKKIIQFSGVAAVLQLQTCSCSRSILLNQLKMSNNLCVQSLVMIDKLFSKLFHLLLLPALYLKKCCWYHDLDTYTRWGKVWVSEKNFKRFSSYNKTGPYTWHTLLLEGQKARALDRWTNGRTYAVIESLRRDSKL